MTYILREYNQINEKTRIKNPENDLEYTIQKQWERIVAIENQIWKMGGRRIVPVIRKILQIKILLSEELNKID